MANLPNLPQTEAAAHSADAQAGESFDSLLTYLRGLPNQFYGTVKLGIEKDAVRRLVTEQSILLDTPTMDKPRGHHDTSRQQR
jgi:hypothetical protein